MILIMLLLILIMYCIMLAVFAVFFIDLVNGYLYSETLSKIHFLIMFLGVHLFFNAYFRNIWYGAYHICINN